MRISIMQPGYLPWLGFFDLMARCELFVILDDVRFAPRDWRSRNRIRTKDGWVWLTVPVLSKGRAGQNILDAQINNDINWRHTHLNCLRIHYAKAPYFKDYIRLFEDVYTRQWNSLLELDMALISSLSRQMKIETPVMHSSSLSLTDVSGNERIIKICQELDAQELYDSQGAKPFIQMPLFEEANIRVVFQDYRHPEYQQVYEPFLPYMSVVDLLFNEGPRSKDVLLRDGPSG